MSTRRTTPARTNGAPVHKHAHDRAATSARSHITNGRLPAPRPSEQQVVVVGGGLAGLIAAATLAHAGVRVVVLDAAGHAGGRAHSTETDGTRRNLGPHAVFRRGELAATLRRLRVPVPGSAPNLARVRFSADDGSNTPGIRLAPNIAQLSRAVRHAPTPGVPTTAWLDQLRLGDRTRMLVELLIRTSTYVAALDLLDAHAAWQQLRRALGGVRYVDGGWHTLVAGLAAAARAAGAEIRVSAPVRRVHTLGGVVTSVELHDGTTLPATGVVLAVGGPGEAARLLDEQDAADLRQRDDVAVRMATLDLVLERSGARRDHQRRSGATQVFGLGDDPHYWSVPSRVARLGPDDLEVVHVARYLEPDERGGAGTRAELEAFADGAQPGWRDQIRHVRFLPNLTVTHAMPLARTGGLGGRAPVRTGVHGLAMAGDGIGNVGQLADAAAASAVAAAAAVLADLDRSPHRGQRRSGTDPRRTEVAR